jgi:hypothetical protein
LKPLWSQQTEAPLRGLVLARERNWALAWDAANWLHLFNAKGERQAQFHMSGPITTAACADDGMSFAVLSAEGQVSLLAPDLMPRWERLLPPGLALALASLGEFVAVADAAGSLHLLTADGKPTWKTTLPRPFRHLAFVPERPLLVGCADFGMVGCVDAMGALVWRDGLVAHTGSLACSAEGKSIAVACYSDGLWCYNADSHKRQLAALAPCRLAALSYAGDLILTAGLERTVRLFDGDGHYLTSRAVDGTPVAVALTPLGDMVWLALAEGKIMALQVVSRQR